MYLPHCILYIFIQVHTLTVILFITFTTLAKNCNNLPHNFFTCMGNEASLESAPRHSCHCQFVPRGCHCPVDCVVGG